MNTGTGTNFDYTENWHRYRRLRNVYVLICGSFLLVPILDTSFHRVVRPFLPGFVILWFVTVLVLGIPVSGWRCPRCGKRFSGMWDL